MDTFDHAVIVAGHAILRHYRDLTNDASWFLLDFQKGEPKHYIRHAQRGVELAAADPKAVLIFSGGQTRAEAGPRSEANSYYTVADLHDWWGHKTTAITEDFARDSFENLLFGICRFKEFAGRYPSKVTLVSWAFKEQRFHLHREAIGYPKDRFVYDGPNNPDAIEQARNAEASAIANYTADPYSSTPFYQAKKAERNPFRRQNGYRISCPELSQLFDHAGPEPYAAPLPW